MSKRKPSQESGQGSGYGQGSGSASGSGSEEKSAKRHKVNEEKEQEQEKEKEKEVEEKKQIKLHEKKDSREIKELKEIKEIKVKRILQVGEREAIMFGTSCHVEYTKDRAMREMISTVVLLLEVVSFLNLYDRARVARACGFFNKQLSVRLPATTHLEGYPTISRGFCQMKQLQLFETQVEKSYPVISKYLSCLQRLAVQKGGLHICINLSLIHI